VIPVYGTPGNRSKNVFEIVIVDVTDKDIAKYGRFPWGRDIYGKALKALNSYKAKGVYFDYILSEQDARWPKKDKAFSDEIKSSMIPVFLPYAFVKVGGKDKFPYAVEGVNVFDAPHVRKLDQQVLPPIPQFAMNTTNMGFINVFFSKDNILKDITTILKWQNNYYPFVGIAIAAHFYNVPIEQVHLRGKTLQIGTVQLPLRKGAKFRPEFGRPFDKYRHFSYADLLEGTIEDIIKGKFVIMGFNATGLSNFLVTTSSNRFPGSEVTAVFLDYVFNRGYGN